MDLPLGRQNRAKDSSQGCTLRTPVDRRTRSGVDEKSQMARSPESSSRALLAPASEPGRAAHLYHYVETAPRPTRRFGRQPIMIRDRCHRRHPRELESPQVSRLPPSAEVPAELDGHLTAGNDTPPTSRRYPDHWFASSGLASIFISAHLSRGADLPLQHWFGLLGSRKA